MSVAVVSALRGKQGSWFLLASQPSQKPKRHSKLLVQWEILSQEDEIEFNRTEHTSSSGLCRHTHKKYTSDILAVR